MAYTDSILAIVNLFSLGYSVETAAKETGIPKRTVVTYIQQAYRQYGCDNAARLVAIHFSLGLIKVEDIEKKRILLKNAVVRRDIVDPLSKGRTLDEMTAIFGVSRSSVDHYISTLKKRFKCKSTAHLVATYYRLELLKIETHKDEIPYANMPAIKIKKPPTSKPEPKKGKPIVRSTIDAPKSNSESSNGRNSIEIKNDAAGSQAELSEFSTKPKKVIADRMNSPVALEYMRSRKRIPKEEEE
jgi:DNA-binding CsgD family transcriptional regulator